MKDLKNEENVKIIKRYILEVARKNQLGLWQGVRRYGIIGFYLFSRCWGRSLRRSMEGRYDMAVMLDSFP